MIDVAIAIDGEAVNVIKTTRAAGGYDENGNGVPGAETTSTIRAAIQPAKGNQLMDLPEGIRTEAGWLLWSRAELKVDDQITAGTVQYRIMYLWPRAEGGFHRAALGRLTK